MGGGGGEATRRENGDHRNERENGERRLISLLSPTFSTRNILPLRATYPLLLNT